MQLPKTLQLVTLLSTLALSANAEIFKLNDGRTLDAKISFETTDSYILSIEVSKGIRDEITVKKSDVISIKKSTPRKRASAKRRSSGPDLKRLQKLLLTADLMDESDYQRLLSRRIEPQLKEHAQSPEIDSIKEIESVLRAEKERVSKGELKLDGKWLTAQEVTANKYEIDAAIIAHKIKKLLKSKDYSEAFTELSLLKDGFVDTKPFREATQLCLKVLPIYQAQARAIVTKADAVALKRDQAIQRLPSAAAIDLKKSLAIEESQYQSALTRAKVAKSSWLPLNRYHPESARSLINTIDKEMVTLQAFDTTNYVDSGELYRRTLEELDKGDTKAASKLISQFSKSRPDKAYVNLLRDKASQLSAELNLIKKQKKEEADELRRLEREAKLQRNKKPTSKPLSPSQPTTPEAAE